MTVPVTSSAVAFPVGVNPLAVTTSTQTLVTAPPNTANVAAGAATASVVEVFVANTSGSAINVTMYKVPSGGTAGTGNMIMNAIPVNTNDTKLLDGTAIFLNAGDTLQISASATGLTVTPSVVNFQ